MKYFDPEDQGIDTFRATMEAFFLFDREILLSALQEVSPEHLEQYEKNVSMYVDEKGFANESVKFEMFWDALQGMRDEMSEVAAWKREIEWRRAVAEHERYMRKSYHESMKTLMEMAADNPEEAADLIEMLEIVHEPYAHSGKG